MGNRIKTGPCYLPAQDGHFGPNLLVFLRVDPFETQCFTVKGDINLIRPQGVSFLEQGRPLEALLNFYAGDVFSPIQGFNLSFLPIMGFEIDM